MYPCKTTCNTAGSIHLFKTTGTIKAENVTSKLKLYLGYYRNRLGRRLT